MVYPEFIPETPALGKPYCPACEPERDPTLEILETRWCVVHSPRLEGADDAAVRSHGISLMSEGDGETGRAYAEVLHRGRTAR